jgi:hypothetical protein
MAVSREDRRESTTRFTERILQRLRFDRPRWKFPENKDSTGTRFHGSMALTGFDCSLARMAPVAAAVNPVEMKIAQTFFLWLLLF